MDKSRVEPTIFFIEKISFSLKLFSGHFYGQSFIKTVRGPLEVSQLSRPVYVFYCNGYRYLGWWVLIYGYVNSMNKSVTNILNNISNY